MTNRRTAYKGRSNHTERHLVPGYQNFIVQNLSLNYFIKRIITSPKVKLTFANAKIAKVGKNRKINAKNANLYLFTFSHEVCMQLLNISCQKGKRTPKGTNDRQQ